jgi:hypothetical protein
MRMESPRDRAKVISRDEKDFPNQRWIDISGDISDLNLASVADEKIRNYYITVYSQNTSGRLDLTALHQAKSILFTVAPCTCTIVLPESTSLDRFRIEALIEDGEDGQKGIGEISLEGGPVENMRNLYCSFENVLFLNKEALRIFDGAKLESLSLKESAVTPYDTLFLPRTKAQGELLFTLDRMRLKWLDLKPLHECSEIHFQVENNLETLRGLDLSVLDWNPRLGFYMRGTHVDGLDISPLVARIDRGKETFSRIDLRDLSSFELPLSDTPIDITPLVRHCVLNIFASQSHWFKCHRETFVRAFKYHITDVAWGSVRWPPDSEPTFEALEKATKAASVDWSTNDGLEWPWNTDIRGEAPAIKGKPRIDLY